VIASPNCSRAAVKLRILHLSDIHLKSGHNAIMGKLPGIRGVLEAHDLDACLLTLSGDIAFSGKRLEYAIAAEMAGALKTAFEKLQLANGICYLPGNHDCNFEKADKTRELVVQGVVGSGGKDVDESMLDSCLRVQDEFFDFLSEQSGYVAKNAYQRLSYHYDFTFDGTKVRVNCFNTAWVSQKPDKQSEIVFPVADLRPTPTGYGVVVSTFHHPYTWLLAGNGRAFRKYVEENSDIILTGHEHEGTAYTKYAFSGENTTHLEGGVFQDSQYKEVSTFNVLLIDTTERKFRVEQYEWKTDIYTRYFQSEEKPFVRGKILLRNEFPISTSFLADLDDPGAQFNKTLYQVRKC